MDSDASPTPSPLHVGARIGLFVGVYEGTLISAYDIGGIGSSPRWLVLAWGLAIVAVNIAFWSGWMTLFRGSRRGAVLAFVTLVGLGRYLAADRFSLYVTAACGLLAFLMTLPKDPKGLDGAIGGLIALIALWSRVPHYASGLELTLMMTLPMLFFVAVVGVAPLDKAWPSLLLCIPAALFPTFGHAPAAPAEGNPPNLLIVLVDTLRKDSVDKSPTPALDELARGGTTFDQAISVTPKTTPSTAALFTGRYPVHNGVRILNDSLREEERTIAEVLRGHGYETGAFLHNAWLMRGRGFEQGFADYWTWFELERPYGPFRYTSLITAIDGIALGRNAAFDSNTDAKIAVDRTIAFIDGAEGPFFAYVHLFDPHWPYRPPGAVDDNPINDPKKHGVTKGALIFDNPFSDEENAEARDLYGTEVTYISAQVGRLLKALDDSGRADNTVVVFTADHGHSLGEHAYHYHHGDFLYDASLRIPLIVRYPGVVLEGERSDRQVRNIDVAPTVLELMGITDHGMDGVNIFEDPGQPAFLEADLSYYPANKRRFLAGNIGKPRGFRDEQFKFIFTPRRGAALLEMYDHTADPEETQELIAAGKVSEPLILAYLGRVGEMIPAEERARMEEMGIAFDALPDGTSVPTEAENETEEMSGADLELLRSLGYVE